MRKFILLLPFLTISFFDFGQLDSISVTAYYGFIELPVTNNSDSTITVKAIKTETWVNDFDFFGEIIVTAYDQETNYPVHKVKHTLQSINDNSLYESGLIKVEVFHGLEEGRKYRVDVLVRDYQGMNLPIKTKILN